MDSFVYHTRPDLAGGEPQLLLDATDPQKSGASAIIERRSGTQEHVASTLSHAPSYSFINALTEGLRADEKQLFTDTHVDARTGLLKRSGLNMYKRLLEDGHAVSMAFLDGDHFGALNHVCKKEFVDRQISIIGKELAAMTESLRDTGADVYAVLWGGEEFVIFGDIEKEVLVEALTKTIEKIRATIRGSLSEITMNEIASYIFLKKYHSLHDGLKRATDEIGGITGGVSRFQMSNYTEEAARKTITYTDEILKQGKNNYGRGTVYPDKCDIATATHNASHLNESVLSQEQNARFAELSKNLETVIAERFLEKTPHALQLLQRVGTDTESKKMIVDFFKTPPFSLSGAEKIAEKSGISIGELRTAKLEIMRAQHDYGTYTGAATPRKIDAYTKSHTVAGSIAISEFKSINDTLGHTQGDTYLMWCFNEVILAAAEACGLSAEDIIIAQERASFTFRIRSGDKRIFTTFESELQRLYSKKLAILKQQIDPHQPSFLDSIREDWIRKQTSDTIGTRIESMNTLIITPTL